ALPHDRRSALPRRERHPPRRGRGKGGDQVCAHRVRARRACADVHRHPPPGAGDLMDRSAQIIEAITAWLGSVATQLLGPALESAAQLMFARPAVDEIPEVGAAWSVMRILT